MPDRWLRCFAAATALMWLAGCASAAREPPAPYMSPYQANASEYGYSEERLGTDTWRVTYRGPWLEFSDDPARREATIDRAIAAASDLALWRAAQLALSDGKPAFAVIDRRMDTETVRRPESFRYDPFGPYHADMHAFGRYPYALRPVWTPPEYLPARTAGRATAILTVRMEPRVRPTNQDAAALAQRLQQIWGGLAPPR